MTFVEAIFLATIQGLTEFLPISSSGHLAFFENIFSGLNSDDPEVYKVLMDKTKSEVAFNVFVHMGTFLSIIVFYYHDIKVIFLGWLGEVKQNKFGIFNHFAMSTLITTLCTATVGFTMRETGFIYNFYIHLEQLALLFLFMAFILYSVRFSYSGFSLLVDKKIKEETEKFEINRNSAAKVEELKKRKEESLHNGVDMMNISLRFAIIVGIVQGIAVLPGISRSGITIAASLILGLKLNQSMRYVMLISIPVFVGVFALEFGAVIDSGLYNLDVLVVSFIVAFAVGLVSLNVFSFLLDRRKLHYFSFYLLFFSGVVYYIAKNPL